MSKNDFHRDVPDPNSIPTKTLNQVLDERQVELDLSNLLMSEMRYKIYYKS